jgi:hypothetical protein
MTTDLQTLKLALLAEWQYLCHDDFEEGVDMTEDQYWDFLQELTPEYLYQMEAEDFDEKRTADMVLSYYKNYLSPKYELPAIEN